jgi:hypothetical protein
LWIVVSRSDCSFFPFPCILIGVTLCSLYTCYAGIQRAFGTERITVSEDELIYQQRLLGIETRETLPLAAITQLSVREDCWSIDRPIHAIEVQAGESAIRFARECKMRDKIWLCNQLGFALGVEPIQPRREPIWPPSSLVLLPKRLTVSDRPESLTVEVDPGPLKQTLFSLGLWLVGLTCYVLCILFAPLFREAPDFATGISHIYRSGAVYVFFALGMGWILGGVYIILHWLNVVSSMRIVVSSQEIIVVRRFWRKSTQQSYPIHGIKDIRVVAKYRRRRKRRRNHFQGAVILENQAYFFGNRADPVLLQAAVAQLRQAVRRAGGSPWTVDS